MSTAPLPERVAPSAAPANLDGSGRLRICFVCGDYPPGPHGGIGTMTQVLGRALVRRGHDVRVIGVYPAGYPAPDVEVDAGVRVVRLRETRHSGGWIMDRVRSFRMIADWARAGAIDLVEVPDWQGGAAGWPRLPVPVIVRLNGSASYFAAEEGRRAGVLLRELEHRSLRRADFICAASRYTAARTESLFRLDDPVDAVIHNPVEAVNRKGSGVRNEPAVVFSGTLVEKKGVVPLITAWPSILTRVPGARLDLYGKDASAPGGGSMREYLRQLLPAECRPSVTFHGHVPRERVLAALETARAAVFPSYAEAFALAPLEAMSAGVPTVSTRRGSGPEGIEDGVDGLLVDPDRPPEIAEALVRLLTDDALARRLGEAGRARVVEEFSIDTLAERNEAFYRSCIAAQRETPRG